jgi:hypothetical protein
MPPYSAPLHPALFFGSTHHNNAPCAVLERDGSTVSERN